MNEENIQWKNLKFLSACFRGTTGYHFALISVINTSKIKISLMVPEQRVYTYVVLFPK